MYRSYLLLAYTLFISHLIHAFLSQLQARSDIEDCLTTNNVPYAVQSSANWTALSTPYNLALVYTPAVITIPETPDHVSSSVTCAAAAGLKVQAKGGGHSYASYSSGGQDGSLVIEMENFSSIEVDQTTFIAKVGAGQRLGNVAQAIYSQGQRALPHGTCPGVGIAGHALHGGYGYASRKWGLALDHIVALDVVLANGTQIHANSTSYPDIFYAMRGAGDSFGIATYFYLQTEAAPSSVLYFSAPLTNAVNDASLATAGFQTLQNWTLTSPDLTPNITFNMYIDTSGTFSFTGWCMDCDSTYFSNNVLPAMLAGFPSVTGSVQQVGWIDALNLVSNGDSLTEPLGSAYTYHDTFYAKSVVTREAQPLTTASMSSFFTYMISNRGKGPFFSIVDLYGGPGSQINVPPSDSSAYSDRDALWVFQNYGRTANSQPPFDPALTGLIDGLNDAITNPQPDGDFTAYLNYVDPDLSATTAAQLYYGTETYDKLVGIKTNVDPNFLFWNPQAIGNANL
ncbi:Glucooligosaccharide oxidase [Stipitochalara longipes BDJ]|nr:Glucooligosaccharide oxidase [Stipitochalara longipes BDJ]